MKSIGREAQQKRTFLELDDARLADGRALPVEDRITTNQSLQPIALDAIVREDDDRRLALVADNLLHCRYDVRKLLPVFFVSWHKNRLWFQPTMTQAD
jgi:hypothetical protein